MIITLLCHFSNKKITGNQKSSHKHFNQTNSLLWLNCLLVKCIMDYACCEAYALTPAGEVCSAEQDVLINLWWQTSRAEMTENNRLIGFSCFFFSKKSGKKKCCCSLSDLRICCFSYFTVNLMSLGFNEQNTFEDPTWPLGSFFTTFLHFIDSTIN